MNMKRYPLLTITFLALAACRPAATEWTESEAPKQLRLDNASASIASALRPAGLQNASGVISTSFLKDSSDPAWKDDPAMKAWNVWMDKYNTRVDKSDYYAPYGYNIGFAVEHLLKQCGDDLSRENIMRQASHLDMALPLLLPGIRLKTSPTDLRPIKQMRLVRFDGERYVLFSDVLASE